MSWKNPDSVIVYTETPHSKIAFIWKCRKERYKVIFL